MPSIFRNSRIYIAVFVLFLLAFPFLVGQSSYYMGLVVTMCMYAIAAAAMNLLTGYGGQISIGQNGFLIVGAYTVAILGARFNAPIWLALPAAGVVSAGVGFIIGVPATRLRGLFLAIATLGFGLSMPAVALNWDSLTNGYSGMEVSRPDLVSSDVSFFYVVAVLTMIIIWMALNIAKSRMGRTFVAIRDSEVTATATGINVALYKTIMFTLSAFFTGIAGGVYVYWIGFVSPHDFAIMDSFLLLAMIVVGGLASIWGAIWGAILFTLIPHFAQSYTGITTLVIGSAVMVVILLRPTGIASLIDLVKPADTAQEDDRQQHPAFVQRCSKFIKRSVQRQRGQRNNELL